MQYIKQDDYDKFICIADKCPESCCLVWQIMIDEESLEKYTNMDGDFGDYLKDRIDWQEGCFLQNEGRCALLNEKGLCMLQLSKGEDALCYTCGMFPRHIEEYENVREMSLSLSCPHVANTIIKRTEKITFDYEEDDHFDEPEEYEDFDYLLYTKLCDAREVLYDIVDDRSLSLEKRMALVLECGKALQCCVDDNAIFMMDESIEDVKLGKLSSETYDFLDKNNFAVLFELEVLHDDWREHIDGAWDYYFAQGATSDASELGQKLDERHQICGELILKLLVFTYFCGAVYDDMIYSKVAMCVYMVRWIFMIAMAESGDTLDNNILVKVIYDLAREIEHSDVNLTDLEEFFDKEL